MEGVDSIIIDSLRHFNCDIDEDIASLKDFDADLVVCAVSTFLETICPQTKFPKKMPPSMSARIKFASALAQQIKELGFKGDMGYQTLLYYNEVEVRKVLVFLIEHLPKESSPAASMEPMGYVPKVVKQIEDGLRQSLNKMWLPTELLYRGTRATNNGTIINSFGNSSPLDTTNLTIPDDSCEGASYIPYVTEQCAPGQLIPSLLFEVRPLVQNWKQIVSRTTPSKDLSTEILKNIPTSNLPKEISGTKGASATKVSDKDANKIPQENKVEGLLKNLSDKKDVLIKSQQVVAKYEENLTKIRALKEKEQKFLKESVAKVKVKNKTLAVLSNEENMAKLKNLIKKTENRLVDLANQWNEVQAPLLEEHRTLKSSVSSESLRQQDEQNKLQNLAKNYKEMKENLKLKADLEQNLMERCKELNNKNTRAAYTKRILEIVGNIQKQNKEIQKILSDTKQVQKDINNLTGQVDRSFTLSDELIFRDCKYEESARKAYKLLAALREECDGVLQAVTDMGQAERELRNLEEQIEIEKSKDFQSKLEKVQSDLAEIRKEIKLLV